ncbi:potassium channel regulatory factor [Microthyrium microscopicum]|uniref:Pre-mRNA-splicing factor 18 n=1 Tax=Microthyrium microscopicum TaxID=703497 RepID=A0A6A6URV3_9PEZI|nr:potassium channel regulatory factor [Microthyrium microscopicum]
MDFASLMKSQIAASSKTPSKSEPRDKKFLKRAEIEAQREAAYRASQDSIEKQRREKLDRKRKAEEDEAERKLEREEKKRRLAEESKVIREQEQEQEERARRKRLGLPDLPKEQPKNDDESGAEEDVDENILVDDLRKLHEPIRLFGETQTQRIQRWRQLTGQMSAQPVLTTGPIPTYLELVQEAEMKVPAKAPKSETDKKFLFRQLASYFTMVLEEWGTALAERDPEVKDSYQGKAALNSMIQAREHLRPFFKKLEKGDIDDSVLDPVVEIVHAAQERRYVDANDGYLRLSIGKAAWPIGVTMVGIHERSAREKLHESDKTAHIMSDETTRKYLQSIKRCLSFAQTRWPPDDHLQLMG